MKNEKEEKEAIEALKDAVNGEVGKAVKHLFLAGYYQGIGREKEQQLKKENKK